MPTSRSDFILDSFRFDELAGRLEKRFEELQDNPDDDEAYDNFRFLSLEAHELYEKLLVT